MRCVDCPDIPNGTRKRQVCCRREGAAKATPVERCKAPGCDNLTDRDICDDCDAWVTEQVKKLDRDAA